MLSTNDSVIRIPVSVTFVDVCVNVSLRLLFTEKGRDNESGARFSKLPVITGPVKLFCFPFQMGVSKGSKIVQKSYQLKKQNGLYLRSEHALLFLRLWYQNLIPGPVSYRVFGEPAPGPLDPGTSSLTMRPTRLHISDKMGINFSHVTVADNSTDNVDSSNAPFRQKRK